MFKLRYVYEGFETFVIATVGRVLGVVCADSVEMAAFTEVKSTAGTGNGVPLSRSMKVTALESNMPSYCNICWRRIVLKSKSEGTKNAPCDPVAMLRAVPRTSFSCCEKTTRTAHTRLNHGVFNYAVRGHDRRMTKILEFRIIFFALRVCAESLGRGSPYFFS